MAEPVTAEDSSKEAQQSKLTLWNPLTALYWGLLFFPITVFLHRKNWQVLGDMQKMRRAELWLAVIFLLHPLLLILIVAHPQFIPLFWIWPAGMHNASMAGSVITLEWPAYLLMLAWYLTSGREQIDYVRTHCNDSYQAKSWGIVALLAIPAMIAWAMADAAMLLTLYIILNVFGAILVAVVLAIYGHA